MMNKEERPIRSAVRRQHAEDYLLISLVAFGATVIFTRVFLEVTGFPQLGNSVLHIAHALWGGLFLFIAVLLPLVWTNRWIIRASALLSGIGIGLFIDEVGKFITQTNDYFFPPALSIIYSFMLLNVFAYLYFRRPREKDPREALYHALEGLQEALDRDFDSGEASRIEAHLTIAKQSERDEIVSLADAIRTFLESEKGHFVVAQPGRLKRIIKSLDAIGMRIGRRMLRYIITLLLIVWTVFVIGYVAVLATEMPTLNPQVIQWRVPLIIIQFVIGGIMFAAALAWMIGNEKRGFEFAVFGFLLSIVAFQTIYFYITQFSAVITTFLQLAFIFILMAYRRWFMRDQPKLESLEQL
jgi:hypothetical protein